MKKSSTTVGILVCLIVLLSGCSTFRKESGKDIADAAVILTSAEDKAKAEAISAAALLILDATVQDDSQAVE